MLTPSPSSPQRLETSRSLLSLSRIHLLSFALYKPILPSPGSLKTRDLAFRGPRACKVWGLSMSQCSSDYKNSCLRHLPPTEAGTCQT